MSASWVQWLGMSVLFGIAQDVDMLRHPEPTTLQSAAMAVNLVAQVLFTVMAVVAMWRSK